MFRFLTKFLANNVPATLQSSICRQRDFSSDWYNHWRKILLAGAPTLAAEQQAVWGLVWAGLEGKHMHRKLWEWCAIAQSLEERGMLVPNKTGMGFAVGQEPLASLFAAKGCNILATDYLGDDSGNQWSSTGQLATSHEAVRWPGLISEQLFQCNVQYQNVDMRDLSLLPKANLDFLWSSCSFEHLGSLNLGMEFVQKAMDCLLPGGIAVHTTEYNVSSNDETIETGNSVIYRRRDIEALDYSLRKMGCAIETLNFEAGAEQHDLAFDYPPYYSHGHQHIKLSLDGHISTSILLVIRKGF
jgi:hypothetical protein